ncbi:MAG: RES family NAD+ phosphorylase [Chloroflexota bacterium]|nr:RES family NAD+ phosphorylase [Chloroflexota bacterium]
MHRQNYPATDASGSRKYSGRYNRGLDLFPETEVWTALYLALGAEVCLGEVLRHVTPNLLPQLNDYCLSELAVWLTAILDCRDMAALGLQPTDLWHDTDCSIPRVLAAAAITQGVEGILVPSATRLGDNLIIFPELLRANASLEIVGKRDPALYVPRS